MSIPNLASFKPQPNDEIDADQIANLITALEDILANIGDTTKMTWDVGKIIGLDQLEAGGAVANDVLEFDGTDWVPSSGGSTVAPGTLLDITVLAAASGTFTTQANTTKIRVRGVAGGGAGGGVNGGSGENRAGGGGGAGGYAEKLFSVSGSTGYAYTCGAGGTGVSAADGGDGADSTFVVGATTVTCKGGKGGKAGDVGQGFKLGGDGGAVSTNGDVNAGGAPGGFAFTQTGDYASGPGGSSLFGGGGNSIKTAGDGNAASGHGAGGSGGVSQNTTDRVGGNGSAGMWIVEEYS